MIAEKGDLTAVETTAPPDHMPQLTDGGRPTGSGKAELTAEKEETGTSPVTDTGTAVTDTDTATTGAVGMIGRQLKVGIEAVMRMDLADMMTGDALCNICNHKPKCCIHRSVPAQTSILLK